MISHFSSDDDSDVDRTLRQEARPVPIPESRERGEPSNVVSRGNPTRSWPGEQACSCATLALPASCSGSWLGLGVGRFSRLVAPDSNLQTARVTLRQPLTLW